MRKLFVLGVLFTTSFAFAQVVATPESKTLNEVYKGGDKKLVEDVQKNLNDISSDYQVNGKFVLTFDLDKDGKIIHPKVLPYVNQDFAIELIRSFKRLKNNFNSNMPAKDLAISFDFTQNFKSYDDRVNFTESPISERTTSRR